jgi:hypothetical protein
MKLLLEQVHQQCRGQALAEPAGLEAGEGLGRRSHGKRAHHSMPAFSHSVICGAYAPGGGRRVDNGCSGGVGEGGRGDAEGGTPGGGGEDIVGDTEALICGLETDGEGASASVAAAAAAAAEPAAAAAAAAVAASAVAAKASLRGAAPEDAPRASAEANSSSSSRRSMAKAEPAARRGCVVAIGGQAPVSPWFMHGDVYAHTHTVQTQQQC